MVGSGCQVWEFLPSQLISLLSKNRIKAAGKFLRNTFSSEVFWSASRNRALTVLELRFLKVLGSVRLSLGLCKILVQFVTTSFDLFPVTLNLFYITHSSSICFPALFKLTKPGILECRALQRGCFGEWSKASLWWAVGEEFQRAGTETMQREAVHSKWLPPLSLCVHFRTDFALKVAYILWSVVSVE